MTLDKINEHIYAFRYDGEDNNVLEQLFEQWNDTLYLHGFFTNHIKDLSYFGVETVKLAIHDTLDDAEMLEDLFLDGNEATNYELVFKPLDNNVYQEMLLGKSKARRLNRKEHVSWLRIYAIRVDKNIYVITGGAIKLSHKMEERNETLKERARLDQCRNFLKEQGVFDDDSFNDFIEEQP